MKNHFVYHPQYTTPIKLENTLKKTIFLIIYDKNYNYDIIFNFLNIYSSFFSSHHDVSLILYLPAPISSEKEAFLSDLNSISETENFPDLIVIQEPIASEEIPRFIHLSHAFIQLSALSSDTWLFSPMFAALLLEKQVIMLGQIWPELEPLKQLLFGVSLEAPQTLIDALKSIYHRNIKINIRKHTLAFLESIPIDLSQIFELPIIHLDTVRMYHSGGYLKEAAGIASQLVLEQTRWWRLDETFFIAHLFFETGYYQRAMDMYSEILLEYPDSVPAQMAMGHIHLKVGDLDSAQKTFLKVQQYEPDNPEIQKQLADIAQRLARRQLIPPILLNGLGNSASDYLSLLLAQGLDIPRIVISARVPPPYNVFVYSPTLEFSQSHGQLAKEHLSPNPLNVFTVNKLLKKTIISIRDPRGTLVSWLFFGIKVTEMRRQSPEEGGFMGGKDSLFDDFDPHSEALLSMTKKQRLDFALENGIYAEFVSDIMGWVEGETKAQQTGAEYLFVVYEAFKQDEMAMINRILDFYHIPPHFFAYPFTEKDQAGSMFSSTPSVFSPNYTLRRGSPTEWIDVLSPAQIQKATAMIPDILFERFHWPRLADLRL